MSEKRLVLIGIPQGSPLSSTLYIVATSTLQRIMETPNYGQFQDDVAFWCVATDLPTAVAQSQELLQRLEDWARRNAVVFNTSKTQFLVVNRGRPKEVVLRMCGKVLPCVDTATYLGVRLHRGGGPRQHCAHAARKVLAVAAIARRVAGFNWVPARVELMPLYTSVALPALTYGMSSWSNIAACHISRLQRAQNAVLRAVTGAMATTPVRQLIIEAGALPIDVLLGEQRLRLLARGLFDKKPCRIDEQVTTPILLLGYKLPTTPRVFTTDYIGYRARCDQGREDTPTLRIELGFPSGHPAPNAAMAYVISQHNPSWVLYTDGSATDEAAAAGVFISNNNLWRGRKVAIPASSTTVEMVGIVMALEWIGKNVHQSTVMVVTDSQAAITSIYTAQHSEGSDIHC